MIIRPKKHNLYSPLFYTVKFVTFNLIMQFPLNISKIVLQSVLVLVTCATAAAQPYALAFEKNYGGSEYDWPAGFVVLEDSSIVVAAQTNSNDFDVSSDPEQTDFWVYKIDENGVVIWDYTYGGESSDLPGDIVQTIDGGFVIAGYTTSDSGDISISYGFSDMWVIKINSEGILEWELSIGGSYDDALVDISINSDNEIIFTGPSTSDDGMIGTHYGPSEYADIVFGKISQDGDLIFLKILGSVYDEESFSIIQNSNGNYLIAGYQFIAGLEQEGYITELSVSGEQLWENKYGGTDYDQIHSIAEIGENTYYFTGYTYSNDGDISGNHSDVWQDMWVGKINGTGALLWSKCYGGSRGDEGIKILPTSASAFIVGGFTASPNDGDIIGNHYSATPNDIWIVEMDTAGIIKWSNCYGGFAGENFQSINPYGNGFAVLGVCRSTDGDVANHYGDTEYPDVWLFKLDKTCDQLLVYPDADEDTFGDSENYSYNCTIEPGYVLIGGDCDDTNDSIYPGANEVLNGLDDNCDGVIDDGVEIVDLQNFIQVYPTLTATDITIQISTDEICILEIYNLTGELIERIMPDKKVTILPLLHYDSGIYVIKIYDTNANIYSKRFIKY